MRILTLVALSLMSTSSAFAVATEAPPADGAKLSDIVAKIESRPDFLFIEQVDFASGKYQVIFYMVDGAEVRMEFDPVTGEPIAPKRASSTPKQ